MVFVKKSGKELSTVEVKIVKNDLKKIIEDSCLRCFLSPDVKIKVARIWTDFEEAKTSIAHIEPELFVSNVKIDLKAFVKNRKKWGDLKKFGGKTSLLKLSSLDLKKGDILLIRKLKGCEVNNLRKLMYIMHTFDIDNFSYNKTMHSAIYYGGGKIIDVAGPGLRLRYPPNEDVQNGIKYSNVYLVYRHKNSSVGASFGDDALTVVKELEKNKNQQGSSSETKLRSSGNASKYNIVGAITLGIQSHFSKSKDPKYILGERRLSLKDAAKRTWYCSQFTKFILYDKVEKKNLYDYEPARLHRIIDNNKNFDFVGYWEVGVGGEISTEEQKRIKQEKEAKEKK